MTTRRSFQSILLLAVVLLTVCCSASSARPDKAEASSALVVGGLDAPSNGIAEPVTIPATVPAKVQVAALSINAEAVTAPPLPTVTPAVGQIDAEAKHDKVYVLRQNVSNRQTVPSRQKVSIGPGDGIDVNRQGSAILSYQDWWTAEVLRDGSLQIHKLTGDPDNFAAQVRLRSGALFNNFDSAKAANLDLTVQGDLATVVAHNASMAVVEEATTSLQWTITTSATTQGAVPTGLLPGASGSVHVTTDGVTVVAPGGTAIWASPNGPPSQPITVDLIQVEQWLQNLENGIEQPEIGEILLPPADVQANICAQPPLLQPNQPFDLNGVAVTLASESTFGPAKYWVEDCNKDGLQDIAMRNGSLRLDFRSLPVRVRAVDVPLVNRAGANAGFLTGLDPAVKEMQRQPPATGSGQEQLLSLRSAPGYPYHYADLTLKEGCFLGVSLTPPSADGAPGAPRRPAPETFPVPGAMCQLAVGRGKPPRTFLRTGPGGDYPSTTTLVQRGDALASLAQNPAGDWLKVKAPNGKEGWAPLTFLSCVEIRCLPVVKPPPPPPPTAAPAPAPAKPGPRPTSTPPAATPTPVVPIPPPAVEPK